MQEAIFTQCVEENSLSSKGLPHSHFVDMKRGALPPPPPPIPGRGPSGHDPTLNAMPPPSSTQVSKVLTRGG